MEFAEIEGGARVAVFFDDDKEANDFLTAARACSVGLTVAPPSEEDGGRREDARAIDFFLAAVGGAPTTLEDACCAALRMGSVADAMVASADMETARGAAAAAAVLNGQAEAMRVAAARCWNRLQADGEPEADENGD